MHFSCVLCIKMTFTDFIYMLCYMIGISIINKWYCVYSNMVLPFLHDLKCQNCYYNVRIK